MTKGNKMIPLFKVRMSEKAPELVGQVLLSGYIGEGEKVKEFEAALGKVLNSPSIPLALNSCTSAIALALHLLDVGPGDEVITTPITCTATNSPIITCGATVVFADVDRETGNICPKSVEQLMSQATKAVIAVDWTGRSCDYDALLKLGVPIIQDAAHGPFVFDGRSTGDMICLSFQAIKHMTTGDGGALIFNMGTRNAAIRNRARLLRWYGLDRESRADFRCSQNLKEIGYKFHMNDINAQIGLANLPQLLSDLKAHNNNAYYMHCKIVNQYIELAPFDPNSAYWVFPIRTHRREELAAYLESHGIASSQVHAANNKHDAFPESSGINTLLFDHTQLNIPCGWWVDRVECNYIINVLNEWQL